MIKDEESEKRNFDFGFEHVSAREKTEKVSHVFESVASCYDVMNDIMSFGIHRLWKMWFVNSLPLHQNGVYLDVAGGTGDIAQAIAGRLKRFHVQAEIMVSDINLSMIKAGKKRLPYFKWACFNAEALPLPDNSIDVYTIAFGLRNVTYREQALKEAHRVLRSGGKFCCLEFSQVSPVLKKAYDFYSFQLIPKLGEWIAQDRESYEYLSESIRTFLTREELLKMMHTVGFSNEKCQTYTGGIVAVHTGYKL